MNNWISVKDRLPERKDVIIRYKNIVSVGFYDHMMGFFRWRDCDERGEQPTHWQSLPEPPTS